MPQQIEELQKRWYRLWYAMADGDQTRYVAIKAMDAFEFWEMYENWDTRNKAEQDRVRNLKNKKR